MSRSVKAVHAGKRLNIVMVLKIVVAAKYVVLAFRKAQTAQLPAEVPNKNFVIPTLTAQETTLVSFVASQEAAPTYAPQAAD